MRHHSVGLPVCRSCHSAQLWGRDLGASSAGGPTSPRSALVLHMGPLPYPDALPTWLSLYFPDLGPLASSNKGGCLPAFPNLMIIGLIPRRKRRRQEQEVGTIEQEEAEPIELMLNKRLYNCKCDDNLGSQFWCIRYNSIKDKAIVNLFL